MGISFIIIIIIIIIHPSITDARRSGPQELLRIAALGKVDGGKSTLVGVLTKGCLDNGQGLARMQVG